MPSGTSRYRVPGYRRGNVYIPTTKPRYEPGFHKPHYNDSLWTRGNKPSVADGKTLPSRHQDLLHPLDISLLEKENRAAHHTTEYRGELGGLVVRRGQPFRARVTLDKVFRKDEDAIYLELATGSNPQQSKLTLIRIKCDDSCPPGGARGTWTARTTGVEKDQGGSIVTLEVRPPPDAIVGKYLLHVETSRGATGGAGGAGRRADEEGDDLPPRPRTFREKSKQDIYVLFNAWCKDDAVYMEDEAERAEYVMNESGRIFVGASHSIRALPWSYGQFDAVCLEAALHLLDISYLRKHAHGNQTLVTRALSSMTNSNDQDSGVLCGNWSGEYSCGRAPTEWTGSVRILTEYMAHRPTDVKYGQCWVFSGLLTTLCRTLGIPTRSVTNFQSAHDTDYSLTIDTHVNSRGEPLNHLNDSIWNFHVWNESWFRRADLPEGNDGWQAFDATPQEDSEGIMQCGPAPLAAIKQGQVYMGYDARFIFAEVNGDCVTWLVEDDGTMRPLRVDRDSVGRFISTKAVGGNSRLDITRLYKHPEGSAEERAAVSLASRYSSRAHTLQSLYDQTTPSDVTFDFKAKMAAGGDITMTLTSKNESSDMLRDVSVYVHTYASYYTGTCGDVVYRATGQLSLKPGKSEQQSWSIDASFYLNTISEDADLVIYAFAKVAQTRQTFAAQEKLILDKPDLDVQISESEVKLYGSVEITISFTNTLSVNLTNGVICVDVPGVARCTKIALHRTLKPGQSVKEKVCTKPMYVCQQEVIASLTTDQLTGVTGAAKLTILDV